MLPQALLDALLRLLREALRSAPGLVLRVLDIAFSPLFVLGNMKNEGKGWIGTAYQHWYCI